MVIFLAKEANRYEKDCDNNDCFGCLDTYNTFTEEYGDTDFHTTDYKYVTAALNDIPEGATIGSRFYVELKDGTVLYATYNPGNNSYDGCAINFDAYVASLG